MTTQLLSDQRLDDFLAVAALGTRLIGHSRARWISRDGLDDVLAYSQAVRAGLAGNVRERLRARVDRLCGWAQQAADQYADRQFDRDIWLCLTPDLCQSLFLLGRSLEVMAQLRHALLKVRRGLSLALLKGCVDRNDMSVLAGAIALLHSRQFDLSALRRLLSAVAQGEEPVRLGPAGQFDVMRAVARIDGFEA